MYGFVGLGNPTDEYKNNRHNIGFMAVNYIASCYGISSFTDKFHGKHAKISFEDNIIHLLKPDTYMNKSGLSVHSFISFFKIPPRNIFVFHDDLDVSFGTIKLKKGGGAGGHNGLRSINQHIGQEYKHIRMGIGRPKDRNKVTSWVLGDFTKEQHPVVHQMCQDIMQNIPNWLFL